MSRPNVSQPSKRMGWKAEVVVWPGRNEQRVKAPVIFTSQKRATRWVEEEASAWLSMEVPQGRLFGFVRHGEIINPDTSTARICACILADDHIFHYSPEHDSLVWERQPVGDR